MNLRILVAFIMMKRSPFLRWILVRGWFLGANVRLSKAKKSLPPSGILGGPQCKALNSSSSFFIIILQFITKRRRFLAAAAAAPFFQREKPPFEEELVGGHHRVVTHRELEIGGHGRVPVGSGRGPIVLRVDMRTRRGLDEVVGEGDSRAHGRSLVVVLILVVHFFLNMPWSTHCCHQHMVWISHAQKKEKKERKEINWNSLSLSLSNKFHKGKGPSSTVAVQQ